MGTYNSSTTTKMTWSIDTSISFITLLLTGTWSFLQIWNYVAQTYWRAPSQGLLSELSSQQYLIGSLLDSGIEASVAREQDNLSPEILLESGLFHIPDQAYGLSITIEQCF